MSPFSLNTLVFSQFSATLLAVESHNPISPSSLSCGPLDLRQDVLTLDITKNFSPLDDFRFATIMPGEIASSRRPLPDQPTSANDPCPGHRNIDRRHPRATTMPQDPATGRHRPGRRSHPPLLPTRTAAGPQSSARALAIGTLPPRLPAPRGAPLAHRPGAGPHRPAQKPPPLPRTPLWRRPLGRSLRSRRPGTRTPTDRRPQ